MPKDARDALRWCAPLLGRAQALCWRQGLSLCWKPPEKALLWQALLQRLDQAALLVSLMTAFIQSDSIHLPDTRLSIVQL